MWLQDVMDIPLGYHVWCHGSILGVTVYCRQCHPYHHTSYGSGVSLESKGRIEAFTKGSSHTNTIVIAAEIESGLVAKDDMVQLRCSPVS
ncbi:hypothetical protein TNCV_3977211 [Trichonephila clavipes]|nr:hypothetical protein TNCV_3977211 [Trichonephila clavipes]